jgi:hypothetical protein
MQPNTAMASAMKAAGMKTGHSALYVMAVDALKKRGRNPVFALEEFVAALTDGAEAVVELMGGHGAVRSAALGYLQSRAAEMNGAGGRSRLDDLTGNAPSAKTTAGQPKGAALGHHARPSSTNRSGGGRPFIDAQTPHAAPAREPSSADRKAAAVVALSAARTVLDSFKIRDGRSIGDVTWKEVATLRATNAREASVLGQIQKRVAHADGDARIRDLIGADELARIVQKAAEVADAA